MMFLRGDIWRAVAINRLQNPTLLSLRDSRPAKTKASVLLVFSVTPFKIDENKNQNHSTDKVQNLGNERR